MFASAFINLEYSVSIRDVGNGIQILVKPVLVLVVVVEEMALDGP